MPASKRRPRRDNDGPLHKPKRVLPHIADEYEALGDRGTALELRRHLRGGTNALIEFNRAGWLEARKS